MEDSATQCEFKLRMNCSACYAKPATSKLTICILTRLHFASHVYPCLTVLVCKLFWEILTKGQRGPHLTVSWFSVPLSIKVPRSQKEMTIWQSMLKSRKKRENFKKSSKRHFTTFLQSTSYESKDQVKRFQGGSVQYSCCVVVMIRTDARADVSHKKNLLTTLCSNGERTVL